MSALTLSVLLSSLLLGTSVTFISSHWFAAWMGLEISTLVMIPMMIHNHHPRAVEAATKYFIVQATSAAVLLFAALGNAWQTGSWEITHMSHPYYTPVAMMALAFKMGLAPVHFWLPDVLHGLTLEVGFLVATWQKLAPFALILQLSNNTHPYLLTALALLSTLIGGWGGLNQTEVRKLLAYSSIAHMGWMILMAQMAPELTAVALLTYIVITGAMFAALKTLNVTKIIRLATSWTQSPALCTAIGLMLLSLGGLPPLTGFLPKWLIIQELTNQGLPLTAVIMAMAALLSLFFYLRLTQFATLTLFPQTTLFVTPWRTPNKRPLFLPLTIILATSMLPVLPTILALFH
uniref:NADH-ubiquinone oxidoreductase chain 2 n=1 Tax=Dussumieria elopsoides TaxID=454028 RepID=A0A347YEC6_9TELE|nr:NADH dehydrogenase subunit 2 [Dussumieria elopsoides]BAX73583.1 NADH dehydrogenase subunit 2 [Dussumieria elopsoides]